GKSNVVDALSWVMGEQGAKSLRGGKMEDVIFAGTSGRPPLGRAEVSLTIDNTDGALPIDYAEVTISRTMFRSGGSDYAINNSPARLLDVQELLSDSGIGREMHVIVGQGQLDAVLQASPEERRGFIEEAAGVLKHRKRKEKALRKLTAMQANLTRLADLITEIRRQLKPLGRQAEAARRAQVVQADLRDAKARLLADDLEQLIATLQAEVADEQALRQRRDEVHTALAQARDRLSAAEEAAAEAAPHLAGAQQVWFELSGLRERARGTASLAADRIRLLQEAEPEPARTVGRDPAELEAQAQLVAEQEETLSAQVEAAGEILEGTVEARRGAEDAARAEERRLEALVRAAANRREELARLAGRVAAQSSKVEAAQDELARAATALVEAEQRAEEAHEQVAQLEERVARGDAEPGDPAQTPPTGPTQPPHADGRPGPGPDPAASPEQLADELADLDDQLRTATEAVAGADEELDRLRRDERQAHGERKEWTARTETLQLGLRRKDGAGTLLAAGDRLEGLLGSVAALLQVEPGWSTALAAVLGPAAEAVAVTDLDAALRCLDLLSGEDGGQATLLPADAPAVPDADPQGWPTLPAGARWARTLVTAPDHLRTVLDRLLHRVAVVADLPSAAALVRLWPDVTAVTAGGDVVTGAQVRGGSAAAPSLIEVRAAVDEATERVAQATAWAERTTEALQAAGVRREQAQRRVHDVRGWIEQVRSRLAELESRRAAVSRQLGQLAGTAKAAQAEVERLRRRSGQAQEAIAAGRTELELLQERLEQAQDADLDEEPDTGERDRLSLAAAEARTAETEARLHLRTAEERAQAVAGRAEQLLARAREEREARTRSAAREERRRRQLRIARAVLEGTDYLLTLLDHAVDRSAGHLEAAQERLRALETELTAVRAQAQSLTEEQTRLTDSVHRDEVARAEQRLRIDTLRQRSLDELGLDPQILVKEYGPDQPVPPSPLPPGESEPEEPRPSRPYVRAEQEKRLKGSERALTRLGSVNPLALEEFAALEERHQFLVEQLEDLKRSRRDLMDIIKEVDDRVERVFTEAFHDTAREFEGVFSRLFPGGEGRLILTDPSNMLTTGLDVEARPPGKKVKRLSLLSGGERSLTAVALLVAIFKARPSPFYVMDEVEAALDDTNLGRLISIFEELRESSQLIIITHQKRTMEVADALYGVTMRGDGVSTVISQRLREDSRA
ncbi:MAG: chromosome segregation protein, partial [Actinomycetota bacterium]|nr:chromosome segregation protein [Actinomycetota bacterium]